MMYMIAAAVLVALDQLVKWLVRCGIPLNAQVDVIPGVFGLTYVQNTGAAFSSFSGGTAVLAAVSLVVSVLLAAALWKKLLFRHPFGRWMLALTLAGAVGNLIDRVAFGFVTDMFEILLFRFAVFNVADICIVAGVFGGAVYALFFQEKLEKTGEDAAK